MNPPSLNRLVRSELSRSTSAASSSTTQKSITTRRLVSEAKDLLRSPIAGVEAVPRDDDVLVWTVVIEGPAGSLYEGGTFFLELNFTENYPFQAPKTIARFTKATFLTRIYHCNIDTSGRMNLGLGAANWNPCFTVTDFLNAIVALLRQCDPQNAILKELAQQYVEQPAEYERVAREWTRRYAHYE
ncbi:UBC core domain-containing protein [Aphelenchoides fujianensis]|nr:UBC core domain-containing protein [Aphelenchoides fujianensis]